MHQAIRELTTYGEVQTLWGASQNDAAEPPLKKQLILLNCLSMKRGLSRIK